MASPPHILVVEDDREVSTLVARFLRANDMRVSVANGSRAMDKVLEESRIDLVVLDLMLPDEDGLSICRRLRTSSGMAIIMLTAKAEDVDRIIGLEMGADDYLTKPFNPREATGAHSLGVAAQFGQLSRNGHHWQRADIRWLAARPPCPPAATMPTARVWR